MILAANKTGIRLEAFFPTENEDELAGYQPLSGALAPFAAEDGDEMEKIMLWDGREDIGYVDEVDIKMVELAMCGN